MVGEIKKDRYVYYHCTGYADKCQGNPATCRRRYVREEALEKQFTELLGQLKFDDEVLEWVRDALHASHGDERREHEDAIKRHQAEYRRLQDRIHAIYIDKLDGLIDTAFFDKMSNQWREEQNRCQREIDRHQNADKSYLDEGVQLLELARNAQRLFAKQEPREKRRLLNFVLSNCTWEDGEVVATFRQPFDILAETTTIAARNGAGNTANSAKVEIRLSKQDSNQRMDFICIAFSRRKSRAKLRRARSGEFTARNSMSGEGAPVVIPTRFTEDVRADFRARNRLDFRRIVRIGVVMGWPSQSRPLKGSPRDLRALGRASVKSGAANQRSLNMSTPSIAKSRNLKTAASKKRSVKSSPTARRKVTSAATTAKVPPKSDEPKVERVTKQERCPSPNTTTS